VSGFAETARFRSASGLFAAGLCNFFKLDKFLFCTGILTGRRSMIFVGVARGLDEVRVGKDDVAGPGVVGTPPGVFGLFSLLLLLF
jgi:hypothetical protein